MNKQHEIQPKIYRADREFAEKLREQANSLASPQSVLSPFSNTKATPISQKLHEAKVHRQEIDNKNAEKDQTLKENTLKKLFKFLGAETIIIFLFAFLQGFGTLWRWKFKLDDWSFRLVVSATIGQITAMLIIAVQHLFPKKKK